MKNGLSVKTFGYNTNVCKEEKEKKIHDSWGKCLRVGVRTPVEPITREHVVVAFVWGNVALARFVGCGSWGGDLDPLMT